MRQDNKGSTDLPRMKGSMLAIQGCKSESERCTETVGTTADNPMSRTEMLHDKANA